MDGLHPRMARFVGEVEALMARETAVDAILSGVAALAAPLAENRENLDFRYLQPLPSFAGSLQRGTCLPCSTLLPLIRN